MTELLFIMKKICYISGLEMPPTTPGSFWKIHMIICFGRVIHPVVNKNDSNWQSTIFRLLLPSQPGSLGPRLGPRPEQLRAPSVGCQWRWPPDVLFNTCPNLWKWPENWATIDKRIRPSRILKQLPNLLRVSFNGLQIQILWDERWEILVSFR